MFLTSALACLTLNVFFEARGEEPQGQIAVAQVTMNRAKQNPQNVCEEVLKPSQFSWTKHHVQTKKGKPYVSVKRYLSNHQEQNAFVLAQFIASDVLAGKHQDVVGNATHFKNINANPFWAKEEFLVKTIGNHQFYALEK